MNQKEQARLQILNSLLAEQMKIEQAATLMGVGDCIRSRQSQTLCNHPGPRSVLYHRNIAQRALGRKGREYVMRIFIAKRQGMASRVAYLSVVSLALMMSVIWLLGNPAQVHACKCAEPGTPSEEMEKSSAVFAGRVISVRHSYDPDAASVSPEDRATVGFDVNSVWKGAVHEEMYITTPPTGGSCGFTFTEGEEYIVYAYDSSYADGGYTVGICGRTALLQQAQADIDSLGGGWGGYAPQAGTGGPAPAQPQDDIVSRAWIIVLAVAALVLVTGGVAAYAVARRRRAATV